MTRRVIAILFSLLLVSTVILGQDISKQNAQKKKLADEIALINSQLSVTKTRQNENLNSLLLTQKKIEVRKDLISQIDQEIKSYDRSIASKNRDIEKLNARLDTLKTYYERLILNSYKNRDSRVWFMYIMASNDLGQGLRRWSYLRNLSSSVKSQAMDIRSAELDLALERDRLRKLKDASRKVQQEKESEYQVLSQEEISISNTLNSLKKKEKAMRADLNKKKKQVESLNAQIEKILAEAVRQQKKAGTKVAVDYELSSRFSDNKGKFPWPVEKGVIVEKFGQSYHPVFKNVKLPFNNGVNISTGSGSQALCIFDGVVKQVLVMPGYSQCVLVQHGEYFTFYCKLKKVYVKGGDKISTGAPIGVIDTADDGSTVIHFQLWKGTEKQNPENWLRKR